MDPLPLRESPAIFLLRWGYFRGQVIYVRSDNAAHGHLGAVSQNHHPDTPPRAGAPCTSWLSPVPCGPGWPNQRGLGGIWSSSHLPATSWDRCTPRFWIPAVLPSPSRSSSGAGGGGGPGGEGGHPALHPLPPQNPPPWSPGGKTWVFQGCHSNVMHLCGCHGNPGEKFLKFRQGNFSSPLRFRYRSACRSRGTRRPASLLRRQGGISEITSASSSRAGAGGG